MLHTWLLLLTFWAFAFPIAFALLILLLVVLGPDAPALQCRLQSLLVCRSCILALFPRSCLTFIARGGFLLGNMLDPFCLAVRASSAVAACCCSFELGSRSVSADQRKGQACDDRHEAASERGVPDQGSVRGQVPRSPVCRSSGSLRRLGCPRRPQGRPPKKPRRRPRRRRKQRLQ